MSLIPVLGKEPSGIRLRRIKQSPNYRNGRFQNLVPTEVTLKGTSLLKMLREYRNRPVSTKPNHPLTSIRTDLKTLPEGHPTIVWFGHSSYLLIINGFRLLVDPVFSGNASPVSLFAKAFPGTNIYSVEDLPTIDLVLLTHDHYDHLDYDTIKKLIPKAQHFCTSLGVGSHLENWGLSSDRITELDWWETASFRSATTPDIIQKVDEVTLTATPARHFSGRGIKRGATLWSSFVLKAAGYSLFLGGDSGYEEHFRAIGARYGPFDMAILECGQYGRNWPYIHMTPEQTVQAGLDLQAKVLLPVHWAKFTLALHPWDEPIRRLEIAATRAQLAITTPMIGEPVILGRDYPRKKWWELG